MCGPVRARRGRTHEACQSPSSGFHGGGARASRGGPEKVRATVRRERTGAYSQTYSPTACGQGRPSFRGGLNGVHGAVLVTTSARADNSITRRETAIASSIIFVVVGLPTGALGMAWPSIQASLDMPVAGLGLFVSVWSLGYLL